jgi:hypothetical protein
MIEETRGESEEQWLSGLRREFMRYALLLGKMSKGRTDEKGRTKEGMETRKFSRAKRKFSSQNVPSPLLYHTDQ